MQDSKLLRLADRYVGAGLCGLISLVRSGKASPSPSNKSKILLIELFEMGASVMLLPSIKFIKKKYPDAEIHCLTTTSCSPIWQITKDIDPKNFHVMNAGSPLKFVWSFIQTLWKVRRHCFDVVIDYELFMRIPAIFVGLLKTKIRAGFHKYQYEGLYRGGFYNRRCAYNQNTHISKNYLALTKTAFLDADNHPNIKTSVSNDEIQIESRITASNSNRVKQLVQQNQSLNYIIICPDVGPTLPMRNWPKDSFVKLINLLGVQYPESKFVFIGTESDRQTSQTIIEKVQAPQNSVNLCGATTFNELIDLIAHAQLVVTNDNGPAHFAALTGTKTLALFSTDSPFVYGPLGKAVIAYGFFHCSPCISALNHKVSHCQDNKCLQALSPDVVFELCHKLLQNQASYQTINNSFPYLFDSKF